MLTPRCGEAEEAFKRLRGMSPFGIFYGKYYRREERPLIRHKLVKGNDIFEFVPNPFNPDHVTVNHNGSEHPTEEQLTRHARSTKQNSPRDTSGSIDVAQLGLMTKPFPEWQHPFNHGNFYWLFARYPNE